jgi:hypothetical protein
MWCDWETGRQAAPENYPARCFEPVSLSEEADRAAKRWGRSREPPVFARFGRTRYETNVAKVTRYAPKRLPSRRCAGNTDGRCENVKPFEDEDDDEDDYENRAWMGLFGSKLLMPETGHEVIVHHSDGLHKGVTSCRAKKMETMRFQALGEFLRLFGLCRNVRA